MHPSESASPPSIPPRLLRALTAQPTTFSSGRHLPVACPLSRQPRCPQPPAPRTTPSASATTS
eukprot:5324998-Prymnesium_polylepis.1